ncbi:KIF-1 binding protein C terminal-domain-containing protein [Pelagophyceae sp. CCMP2097]|nr:KIF-1 binding protein C terminal-domain-containing protein [Pelagophyceae sp. CCMP2097]
MASFGSLEADVAEALSAAASLTAEPSPEKAPFAHQYAARDVLEAARAGAAAAAHSGGAAALLGARLDVRLGVLSNEVEEPHVAEKWLTAALGALAPGAHEAAAGAAKAAATADASDAASAEPAFDAGSLARGCCKRIAASVEALAPDAAAAARARAANDAVEALNQAAILWNGREEHVRALKLLDVAEAGYAFLGGFAAGDSSFESLHTHTLFFLAQVHARLGNAAEASRYCLATLERQLEAGENGAIARVRTGFDAVEWTRNALGLAAFYAKTTRFECSAACSRAAMAVARALEPSEQAREVRADVFKQWGDLHSRVLANAVQGDAQSDDAGAIAADEPVPSFRGLSLVIDAQMPPAPLRGVVDFAGALLVFKTSRFSLEAAMEFYQLDGCVTDHVAMTRELSEVYKHLSACEPQHRRRQAMRQRRRDLLEPLREILNPKCYSDLRAALAFELGEISSQMLEAKEARFSSGESSNGPSARAKATALRDQAVAAYDDFVYCCAQDDGTCFSSNTAEELGPFLRAKFYAARISGRAFGAENDEDAVTAMRNSLVRFRDTEAMAAKTVDAAGAAFEADFFGEERRLIAEMVSLLPHKINRARPAT